MEEDWTPEKIAEAKRLAKGDLGDALSRVPAYHATTIIIGEGSQSDYNPQINSGTATLVKINDRPIAITCFHIIEEYKKRISTQPKTIF